MNFSVKLVFVKKKFVENLSIRFTWNEGMLIVLKCRIGEMYNFIREL